MLWFDILFLSIRYTELWCRSDITNTFLPRHPLHVLGGTDLLSWAQCLTQGLHKYFQICCTWEETYFSTVWNHKTKITSIGRYLQTLTLRIWFYLPAIQWKCLIQMWLLLPQSQGALEHSCRSLCDRKRAAWPLMTIAPASNVCFTSYSFLRTCFISFRESPSDYYILFIHQSFGI